MFESLSNRLQDVFRSLRGESRLTEATVEAALREIRLALLEADVNFKVVKAFIDRVRDRAMDQEVLKSLTPAQQVVRIVRDEMLALFGDTAGRAAGDVRRIPRVILMLGLQGSGKTTTAAKLGRWLTQAGAAPDDGVDRRPAPGGHPAAERRRQAGGRARARSGGRSGSGARARPARWPKRATAASTRSSSTPPAGCTSTTS